MSPPALPQFYCVQCCVADIYPQNGATDPRANVQANQGETLSPNLEITDVTFGSGTSITVPLKAELWELEFGGQGSDDGGVTTANMTLDGSRQEVRISIPVEISADTSRERGGVSLLLSSQLGSSFAAKPLYLWVTPQTPCTTLLHGFHSVLILMGA